MTFSAIKMTNLHAKPVYALTWVTAVIKYTTAQTNLTSWTVKSLDMIMTIICLNIHLPHLMDRISYQLKLALTFYK